jgi:hypothetical protein
VASRWPVRQPLRDDRPGRSVTRLSARRRSGCGATNCSSCSCFPKRYLRRATSVRCPTSGAQDTCASLHGGDAATGECIRDALDSRAGACATTRLRAIVIAREKPRDTRQGSLLGALLRGPRLPALAVGSARPFAVASVLAVAMVAAVGIAPAALAAPGTPASAPRLAGVVGKLPVAPAARAPLLVGRLAACGLAAGVAVACAACESRVTPSVPLGRVSP